MERIENCIRQISVQHPGRYVLYVHGYDADTVKVTPSPVSVIKSKAIGGLHVLLLAVVDHVEISCTGRIEYQLIQAQDAVFVVQDRDGRVAGVFYDMDTAIASVNGVKILRRDGDNATILTENWMMTVARHEIG